MTLAVLDAVRKAEAVFASSPAVDQLTLFREGIRLCQDCALGGSDAVLESLDYLLAAMAQHMPVDALCELAEALSRLDRAPGKILVTLAEGAYRVSRPILEHSPALDEATLLRIAAAGDENRLSSLAKRVHVSIALSDILVTRGGRATLLTIAQNNGAQFSPYAVELLVERCETDATLQVLLTRRSDMPGQASERLAVLATVRLSSPLERPAPPSQERSRSRVVTAKISRFSGLEDLRQRIVGSYRRHVSRMDS